MIRMILAVIMFSLPLVASAQIQMKSHNLADSFDQAIQPSSASGRVGPVTFGFAIGAPSLASIDMEIIPFRDDSQRPKLLFSGELTFFLYPGFGAGMEAQIPSSNFYLGAQYREYGSIVNRQGCQAYLSYRWVTSKGMSTHVIRAGAFTSLNSRDMHGFPIISYAYLFGR